MSRKTTSKVQRKKRRSKKSDDRYLVGSETNLLDGGESTDLLYGEESTNLLDGGESTDLLYGGESSDTFLTLGKETLVGSYRADFGLDDELDYPRRRASYKKGNIEFIAFSEEPINYSQEIASHEFEKSSEINRKIARAREIREGIRIDFAEQKLSLLGVEIETILRFGLISSRDWNRAKRQGRLPQSTSERIARLIRISALARETFGPEKAALWLQRPTKALDGESPLSLLDTDEGARAVETLIGRIAHGIAA